MSVKEVVKLPYNIQREFSDRQAKWGSDTGYMPLWETPLSLQPVSAEPVKRERGMSVAWQVCSKKGRWDIHIMATVSKTIQLVIVLATLF